MRTPRRAFLGALAGHAILGRAVVRGADPAAQADDDSPAAGSASASASPAVVAEFAKALDRKLVVGGQIAVGTSGSLDLQHAVGLIRPGGTAVNADTQFCIGSCSKPLASAVMLTLAGRENIPLDAPVDRWLPAYAALRTSDGQPARAPTLAELLAHRGGLYSQQGKITASQNRAIRDFRLTLKESVERIAREPLLFPPGSGYAYSGAGYCVAGRVLEVIAHKPFEQLLQEALCRPLGMSRTTYFPAAGEKNVAVGASPGPKEPLAPHEVRPMKLTLVGGSLYSTAANLASFARLLMNAGRHDGKLVLGSDTAEQLQSLPFDGEPYGYGWRVTREGGKAAVLQHNGILYSCRGLIVLDLRHDRFLTAAWTVPAAAEQKPAATAALAATLRDVFLGIEKK